MKLSIACFFSAVLGSLFTIWMTGPDAIPSATAQPRGPELPGLDLPATPWPVNPTTRPMTTSSARSW